jgi:peptidoglycan/LPS O-acetylase OafA/YrhL
MAGGEVAVPAGGDKVRRVQVLDAFRAIAILAVIGFHYLYRWTPAREAGNPSGLSHANAWFRLGSLGVEFFFIISGFVIYMTLGHCRSLPEFFLRRLARLYPAYLLTMLLVFAIGNCCGPAVFQHTWRELLVGTSMMAPHFHVAWIDGVYWSLLVEITFYFWASLLFLLAASRFELWWCAFALVAGLLALWKPWAADSWLAARYLPFFSAGMYFYRRHSAPEEPASHLALCALATYLLTWHGEEWLVNLLVALMACAFMAMNRGWLNWLAMPPLLLLGEISYSLYLLHENIGIIIIHALHSRLQAPSLAAALVAFATCVTMALASTRLVENPGKQWVTGIANRRILPWLEARPWARRLTYAAAPAAPRSAG